MPIVTIQQSERTRQQKAELARGLTAVFVEVYGIPQEAVQVFFDEYDEASWAKGGRLEPNREPSGR